MFLRYLLPILVAFFLTTQPSAAQTFDVKDYHASGSGLTSSGTISAGSPTLTLSSAQDFQDGEGIRVYGAGPSFSVPQASNIAAVQNGTTGSKIYYYKVAMVDGAGGIGVPVTVNISNGNASLSTANNITLTLTPGAGYAAYVVYKSTNGGSTYFYSGAGTQTSWVDTGLDSRLAAGVCTANASCHSPKRLAIH